MAVVIYYGRGHQVTSSYDMIPTSESLGSLAGVFFFELLGSRADLAESVAL